MIDWRRAWHATWVLLAAFGIMTLIAGAIIGALLLLVWSPMLVLGLATPVIVVWVWWQLYKEA